MEEEPNCLKTSTTGQCFHLLAWDSVQICRVEDVDIDGTVLGSTVHVQRVRTISISNDGILSASALGLLYPIFCMRSFLWLSSACSDFSKHFSPS